MEMGLRTHLRQTQQLRMTPQLQHAIKLLQLSRLELIDAVQQEMNENPMLEEHQEPYSADALHAQAPDPVELKAASDKVEEVRVEDRDMDKIDWDAYLNDYSSHGLPSNSYRGLTSSDLPGHEQTLSTSESLVDHLMSQLRLLSLSERREMIGALIIGNLNEVGYLQGTSVADIAADADVTEAEASEVLKLIQGFDPLGVGARDIRECLSIQAHRLMPHDTTVHAIIQHHLKDLERKSISTIARALDVSQDEVIRAARLIAAMEPKPGRPFAQDFDRYITPDIYIKKVDGEYVVSLNDDGLPRLRISGYYRTMLAGKKQRGERDEVRDYIQEKLRGATWLIRSIEQRNATIVLVTESIIKYQREFFDKGIEFLRPLTLKEVADDIERHESTVSRATTNKYVHTPRGVFELKFFFNAAITKTDGEDLASAAIKAKIRDIIADENPQKPISDARIAQKLADEENIDIARRTVAKYREMMGILSSSKRKQVF